MSIRFYNARADGELFLQNGLKCMKGKQRKLGHILHTVLSYHHHTTPHFNLFFILVVCRRDLLSSSSSLFLFSSLYFFIIILIIISTNWDRGEDWGSLKQYINLYLLFPMKGEDVLEEELRTEREWNAEKERNHMSTCSSSSS